MAIILEELSLPYETNVTWDATELQKPPFPNLNPTGRAPGQLLAHTNPPPPENCVLKVRNTAIKDPNTGIVLWESAAIAEYLIAEYDKENKLNYTSFPEKYQLKQWAYFQASGQGPYYGQAAWSDSPSPSAYYRSVRKCHAHRQPKVQPSPP